jgi:hypothetical protein
MRLALEMLLASAVAFGGTLGPLFEGGLTGAEYMAASVAAAATSLALIRQQPPKEPLVRGHRRSS